MSDWEDVAIGPPATAAPSGAADAWEDVAFGAPATAAPSLSGGNLVKNELFSLGNRAVEGTADLTNSVVDNVSPIASMLSRLVTGKDPSQIVDFGGGVKETAKEAYLYGPEKSQTTIGRILGQVAYNAPGAAIPGGSLGTRLASVLGSGVASGVTREVTDSPVADAVATVLGGAAPSVASGALTATKGLAEDAYKAGKRALFGASDEEASVIAGEALRDYTKLTPEQVEAAIAARPRDALGEKMTTAEITGNAPIAQLEKVLTGEGERAQIYKQLQSDRAGIRDQMLNRMTPTEAVNPEALGETLIAEGLRKKADLETAARAAWEDFPKSEVVNIAPEQDVLRTLVNSTDQGLPVDRRLSTLIDKMTSVHSNWEEAKALAPSQRRSGQLQAIRSDTLDLIRDGNLGGNDKRIATILQSSIDTALERELKGNAYNKWQDARAATSDIFETFGRRTAGGTITRDDIRTSNVLARAFRGDSKSVVQLKAAIDDNPEVLNDVKRGVLDMIKRDAEDRITPAAMKKFLAANEGGIKQLFGESHFDDMERIAEDLATEANTHKLAYGASKGNSITSQSNSIKAVFSSLLEDKIEPPGMLGKVWSALRDRGQKITEAKVREAIFNAALDPATAADLLRKPTPSRLESIGSALNALASGVQSGALRGGLAGATVASGSRPQEETQQEEGQGESGMTFPQSPTASTPTQDLLQKVTQSGSPKSLGTVINAVLSTKGAKMDNPEAFGAKVVQIADELETDPAHLMQVMKFETGGELSTKTKNQAGSGATGLIQFMPDTAKRLTGADTKAAAIKILESMTPTEQLDYVKKYLEPFKGKLKSLDDVYMAVLYPKAIGEDPDYALFKKGTKAYWQNRGLDIDKDGVVTKSEAASKVRTYEA